MKVIPFVMVSLAALSALSGCTAQERARAFGGTESIQLDCGQKLVTVTWKDTTLWTATRPMLDDEVPETYTFHADTAYGIMEGTVKINEVACT